MAKVVNPNDTTHKIYLQPRYKYSGLVKLFLKNESTNIEVDVFNTMTILGNELVSITFDFDFKERDKYQIRITEGTNVFYRGKLFATVQETQDFKITEGFITY